MRPNKSVMIPRHRIVRAVRFLSIEILYDAWTRGVAGALIIGFMALAAGLPAQLATLLGVVVGLVIYEVRGSENKSARRLRCLEDHVVIRPLLGTGEGVSALGGWAVAPDFARLIVEEVQRRPRIVVECGSGTSTELIAAVLRSNGMGMLHSIEHDPDFAETVRKRLDASGLSSWVELHVAPLKECSLNGTKRTWYDLDSLPDLSDESVDLLVVDGPPPVGQLARLPALEIMYPKLKKGACILLDDGRRRSERRVARRWASTHSDLGLYWLDTEKGTWKLMRVYGSDNSAAYSSIRRLRRAVHPQPSGFGREPVPR